MIRELYVTAKKFDMDITQPIPLNKLMIIRDFLEKVSDTNEDTTFQTSKDPVVEAIVQIAREKQKTSIIEDFDIPYVHPMITIQKWNAELTQIVDDLILTARQ